MFVGVLVALLGFGLLLWGIRGFNNADTGNKLGLTLKP